MSEYTADATFTEPRYWEPASCGCPEGVIRDLGHQEGCDTRARLEREISEVQEQIAAAEHDVVADMGEDAWEAGGWDVLKDTIRYAMVSDEAKRTLARMHGLDANLVGLARE